MTKVGEGGEIPRPSGDQYSQSLQGNIARFQNALESYPAAANSEELERMKDIMNQQIELIQANVREIKRSGIQKQGEIVVSDYDKFKNNPTEDNRTALQQDMSTLKEYGLLSD